MKVLAPALAFGAALAPAVALACSPAFGLDRHAPTATSTVPANAKLQFVGPLPSWSRISVGEVGGTMVDATTHTIEDQSLWRLSEVLQVELPQVGMGTTVRVVVDTDFGTPEEFLVTPNAPADTTAPTITGPLTVGGYYHPTGTSCIPAEHFGVDIRAAAITDDIEVSHVTAYEVAGGQMIPLSSMAPYNGTLLGLTAYVSAQPAGERCFALVAIDLASNESAPVSTCINLQPSLPDAGPTLDAGPGAATDAGIEPDGGAADASLAAGDDEDTSGCTCLTGRRSSDLGLAGLFGFALLLGLRRRSTS